MLTITHDDNKTYTLPTIFHNIEQESGSKSRVRTLTRDPARTQIVDPVTRRPGSISDAWSIGVHGRICQPVKSSTRSQ